MLHFLTTLAVSIWLTSTIFMLTFYFITRNTLRQRGQALQFPFLYFIYIHFCPIVHTIKAIQILNTLMERRRGS